MNHSFDVDIAVKHGVHAAVLHQTIVFWVLKNKANGKHLHEGRHWTYNSAKAFTELFPYLSADQIQRNLKKLEEAGLVATGCFNSSPYDRTRWYSTAEGIVTDSADLRNEFPQDRGTYTSSNQVQTNSSSLTTFEKATRKRIAPPSRPEGVSEQVWSDWLQLRKAKRAPVTETVVAGAAAEAQKAGMPLGDFLAVWCRRGSQGLEAAWLKPEERSQGRSPPPHRSAGCDRKSRQLEGAAILTGAARQAPVPTTLETIDVAPRVIAA